MVDSSKHPCFNVEAKGVCGRVHLPVAPKCNVMCNYCNRKYDCVNESRPGVTSSVLEPAQALAYMEQVVAREPRITVVGIAGPGDPFANGTKTMETVRLIRERFPEMLLCLSTNGLGLPPYLDELKRYEVSHVTITISAVDPDIGAKIYSWVRDGKVVYRGREAAELMLERQIEGLKGLKERGITVKVNTIVIPGVNDHHIEEIAKTMKGYGVDVLNLMPLCPVQGAKFENLPEPSRKEITALQAQAERYLPQMRHCKRCRADAVGLLDQDRSKELAGCLKDCSTMDIAPVEPRPYVAVATMEGILVNQHLGEAESFQIWGKKNDKVELVETRPAPAGGGGPKRWLALAELLKDCRAVLVAGVGETPRQILSDEGIMPVEMSGFIEQGLHAVFGKGGLEALKARKKGVGGGCRKNAGCSGGGDGCG